MKRKNLLKLAELTADAFENRRHDGELPWVDPPVEPGTFRDYSPWQAVVLACTVEINRQGVAWPLARAIARHSVLFHDAWARAALPPDCGLGDILLGIGRFVLPDGSEGRGRVLFRLGEGRSTQGEQVIDAEPFTGPLVSAFDPHGQDHGFTVCGGVLLNVSHCRRIVEDRAGKLGIDVSGVLEQSTGRFGHRDHEGNGDE